MQHEVVPTLHRTLHPATLQHLQQTPDGSIYSQVLPHLHPGAAIYQQHQQLPPHPPPQALHYLPGSPVQYTTFPVGYQHATSPRFAVAPPLPVDGDIQHFQGPPQLAQQQPPPPLPISNTPQHAPQREQPESEPPGRDGEDAPSSGQFQGLRLIADPPDLEAWRQRLFDVDDTMTLNEDE